MFIKAFVKISLLLYVLIRSSHGLKNGHQNFAVQTSKKIPKCTYSEYVYDPAVDLCAETGTQAHCGEKMVLTTTEILGEGTCVCRSEVEKPCWGRPQILSEDRSRCWNLGERGPCPQGQVLVQLDQRTIQCQTDACEFGDPRNAVNYSAVSETNPEAVLKFTHKGNYCYMTETEAFCEQGQVARFVFPSKIPTCVARAQTCGGPLPAAGANIRVQCDEGYTEDRTRNLCVPSIQFDR